MIKLLFTIAALVLTFGCGPNTEKTAPTVGPKAKPELFLYVTNVDNLRLREKPNQSSEVIAQLKEGAVLEGAGNESTNQELIELRGIPRRAPFYQVTAATGAKPMGWAFGGALTCVYAGPRSGSPDAARIEQFAQFITTLNPKDLDSGAKAWHFVETDLANASQPLLDAAFVLLERFLERMKTEGEFYLLTEKQPFTADDGRDIFTDKFDHSKYPLTAKLYAAGFRMVMGEGTLFPVVNWGRFQEYFGPRTTHTMQKYINQRVAQQNTPMYDDGKLLIPLEKMADVAVFWEKFNRENPFFPLGEQARESERWLRLALIIGNDYAPVFSGDSSQVGQNYRSAWEYIQQVHPNTQLAQTAKEMAGLCAAEGWKRSQKVQDFIVKSVDAPVEE
ncbi:MAG: SH3 domain-containing protein [Saprospiraceae bacterium]